MIFNPEIIEFVNVEIKTIPHLRGKEAYHYISSKYNLSETKIDENEVYHKIIFRFFHFHVDSVCDFSGIHIAS